MKTHTELLAQLRSATGLLQSAGPAAATAAIQRALAGGLAPQPEMQPSADAPQPTRIIDLNPPPRLETEAAAKATGTGRFLSGSLRNAAGRRGYRLYVPANYGSQPLPLVVMLHGCQQEPDDFAAGTGMNALADERDCLVLYPAQTSNANRSHCWNWFQSAHQQRDRGEPSLIADITRAVMREYRVDPERVYVAGLSAGGAMAAVMAATYPELYAALGIHSGLPYGAAQDLPSALAAMKQGHASAGPLAPRGQVPAPLAVATPTIIFHGDRDATVSPRNGAAALAQCVAAAESPASMSVSVEPGRVPNGRSYTQTIHRTADGQVLAEQWLVHGAGHAWSGGSAAGSYTDPRGPDATREMLRFFYEHPRRRN